MREAIAVDVAAGARSGVRIAPPSAKLKQTPYVRRGVPDGAYHDRGARPRAVVDPHLRGFDCGAGDPGCGACGSVRSMVCQDTPEETDQEPTISG